MLSLGTIQNICNQSVAVLWHYTIIIVTPELKTDFSYIKTLIFDLFLMVFNAIDSPDIVSSSKQPKYVTLEYCFISVPLYIILSFPVFSNLSFEPKSMHFVFSSPDEYLIYCRQTIHISWRSLYLIDVQLYEHVYAGMLDRNRPHIKTNRNERPGAYH